MKRMKPISGLFEMKSKRIYDSIQNQYSPARTNRYAGEEIDIDKEKENKEKAARGCVSDDTPTADEVRVSPRAVILPGESYAFDGRNHSFWQPKAMVSRCESYALLSRGLASIAFACTQNTFCLYAKHLAPIGEISSPIGKIRHFHNGQFLCKGSDLF